MRMASEGHFWYNRVMSDKQKITIINGEGAKAHLQDPELIQLTNRVNKIERNKVVGVLCHETARRIFALLGPGKVTRTLIEGIDRAHGPIHHMKQLRDRGHIAVAKDGDATVGMVGYEQCKYIDPKTGRKVYELRRLGVQKEYEGRGIGKELQQAIVNQMREVDPEGIILVEAQHPAVVNICQQNGFTICSLDEGLRLKFGEEGVAEARSRYERMGGTFLRYDPPAQDGE